MQNYLEQQLGDLWQGAKEFFGYGPPPETLEQAQARMAGTTGMDPERLAALNARAKKAGYPSYEAMVLRQRAQGQGARRTQTARDKIGNALSTDATAWHPANTIGRAGSALDAANR